MRTICGTIMVAVLAAHFARAEILRFPDAPFEMPQIPVAKFADRDFSIADFGAKEGVKATDAFAAAMAECEKAGGGRVVVPKGKWLTGAVHLRSNCNLYLAEGATLEFTDDPADYLPAVPSSWEGLECLNYSPLVYAFGCTNVALCGKGVLRPRMAFWKKLMNETATDIQGARAILYKWGSEDYPVERRDITKAHSAVMRPQCVQFNRCKNVLIEDVTICESPFWTIHLLLSEDVTVRNVNVDAHGFNNDGIDIEMSRNVLVDGGVFSAGDDGFVFKAGRNRDGWRIGVPTENVLVRNAHVKFAHSLLCVGSEMSAGVRNVRVENCRVDECWKLFYVKTNARRGGFVDGITLKGVNAGKVKDVLRVDTDVLYQWKSMPTYEERITRIGNLVAENLTVGETQRAVTLNGDGRNPIDGVTLRNVKVGRVTDKAIAIESAKNVDMDGLKVHERESTRKESKR